MRKNNTTLLRTEISVIARDSKLLCTHSSVGRAMKMHARLCASIIQTSVTKMLFSEDTSEGRLTIKNSNAKDLV